MTKYVQAHSCILALLLVCLSLTNLVMRLNISIPIC